MREPSKEKSPKSFGGIWGFVCLVCSVKCIKLRVLVEKVKIEGVMGVVIYFFVLFFSWNILFFVFFCFFFFLAIYV